MTPAGAPIPPVRTAPAGPRTVNPTVTGSDKWNSGGSRIKVINIVPEVSSEDRMHVMDEGCWCSPYLLFEGDGTMKIDHQHEAES